ncbi:MAG: CHASE2 domain-containing protein [Telluria sp.]
MVAAASAARRHRLGWQAPAAAACLGVALAQAAPSRHVELQWLDASFRMLAMWRTQPAAPEVVIVGVDQASIDQSAKPFALMLDEFALALDAMRLGAARAVGVDLVFPANDHEQLVPGASRRLALAIGRLRSTAPVVLGTLGAAGAPDTAAARYLAMAGIDGEGLLQVAADADGSLRRIEDAGGAAPPTLLSTRLAVRLGQTAAAGIVDFALGGPFDYIPMHRVVALARSGDSAALRASFAGKVVMLGVILPDQDRQRIPVRLASWENGTSVSGVVFQAQAVRSLLQQRIIDSAPWLSAVAALLAAAAIWLARAKLRHALAAAAVLTLAILAGSVALLAAGTQVPVLPPLLAAGLLAGGLWARDYARQFAEQRRIRSIFAGYVSPAILDTILSGALENGMAGRRQPLAFLFADIRGFTAFCAATPPEQVIAFLNRYYTAVTEALHRHGGTIDKFSGDGIMVFFGAPQSSANPARDAVLAALAMLDALQALNAELASEGRAPVAVGIGIAYGDAVLGNVGSALRHDYTATGAATTLAAHIQQYCKQVPHSVLVEQGAFELAALPPELQARFETMTVNLDKHGEVALSGYVIRGRAA